MRLLLDTHILIWAAITPERLREAERHQMRAASQITLSAVAVWEVRLKWQSLHVSGGRKGPIGPSDVVVFAEAMGWDFLPLSARHATSSLAQKLAHRDPFDEMLLVQAQEEGIRLLTRDTKLAGHPFAFYP